MSLAKLAMTKSHVISSHAGQVLPCFLFSLFSIQAFFQHNLGWHPLCVNTPRKMSVGKFKIAVIAALLSSFLSLCTGAAFDGTAGQAHARKDREYGRQASGDRDLERLRRIMMPLVRATNHPERLNEIGIKIVADSNINAGSAGGGEFLITTGLLQKANDEQLRGILAHEIAHDDLGHPVKMQLVETGVNIGAALLEKVFPGSGAVAPIAGTLIASSYSRPQEFAADEHGVTILRRAGYSKEVMVRALTWIMQVQGNSGGGFLSTHPATDERIRALRRL
jgi:putative metalloprotease